MRGVLRRGGGPKFIPIQSNCRWLFYVLLFTLRPIRCLRPMLDEIILCSKCQNRVACTTKNETGMSGNAAKQGCKVIAGGENVKKCKIPPRRIARNITGQAGGTVGLQFLVCSLHTAYEACYVRAGNYRVTLRYEGLCVHYATPIHRK